MEQNAYPEQEQVNLFDNETRYTTASQGQRFVNWLVDNILIRLTITWLTGDLMIKLLLSIAPEFTYDAFGGRVTFAGYLVSYAFAVFHYLFYYTICEKACNGYTLGKLLSGTRAIRNDGEELTMKDAILRSLSRMVPFEVFSGFSERPWHDSWTNTTVVKSR